MLYRENGAFYTNIAQANPEQYVTKLSTKVDRMGTITDANDARITSAAIGNGYLILMKMKTVDAAKAMHE